MIRINARSLITQSRDALAGAADYAQSYDVQIPGGKEAFLLGVMAISSFVLDVVDDYFTALDEDSTFKMPLSWDAIECNTRRDVTNGKKGEKIDN